MKNPQPSNLEMQILSVLWEHGPSTVRDILGKIPDGKKRAYTTVLTMMQIMEKKKLLTHKSVGNTHVYQPIKAKKAVIKPLLQNLVNQIFGGSPAQTIQHLLEESSVSQDELEEIKKVIAEFDNENKTKSGGGKNR